MVKVNKVLAKSLSRVFHGKTDKRLKQLCMQPIGNSVHLERLQIDIQSPWRLGR